VVENVRQWNAENRYPPMTYSSTGAAFAAVEKEPLPSAAGEMPSPWDSVQSQGVECFMLDRRLEGRLLAAEKLAAFCSVIDPAFSYPYAQLDEIWQNRLYVFDHNWGGTHGEESDRIKTEKIQTAARITEEVLGRAFHVLAAALDFKKPAPGTLPLVIFNPLSWDRNDIATCEIPAAPGKGGHLSLVDGQGRAVACQLVRDQSAGRAAKVVFPAEVPALGYATYYASWADAPASASSPFTVDVANHTFENSFYRLRLDPATGTIRSLLDKRRNRELVRQGSAYGCNELVVFEDTDEDIGMRLTGRRWLAREHASSIDVVENGPVRLVIQVGGKLLQASMRQQQIILYAAVPKIDLVTKLDWEGKPNVHLYQEFPLNVEQPTVRYAVPYGWEQYGSEMKYAAPWFSHDIRPVAEHRWRGVRGWVELSKGGSSVVLASQCNYAAFKDLSTAPEPGFLIQPLLLRTVRSCGGNHFFYDQRGRHEFRFALEAQADAARLGEELDSPLMAQAVTSPAATTRTLPDRLSFLTLKGDNVHIAVVKKAEDGRGLIARLVEMKERARATQVEVCFFRRLKSVTRTSIIEENQQPLSLHGNTATLSLPPSGIETLRLSF
jgi:alpha-mannosidase